MSPPRLRSKPIAQGDFVSEDAFRDLDLWIQSLGPHPPLRLSPAQIKDVIHQLHDSPLHDLISFLSRSLVGRGSTHGLPRRYPSLRHPDQHGPLLPSLAAGSQLAGVMQSSTSRRRTIAVYLSLIRALSNKERTRLDIVSRVAGSLNISNAGSLGSLRSWTTDYTELAPLDPGNSARSVSRMMAALHRMHIQMNASSGKGTKDSSVDTSCLEQANDSEAVLQRRTETIRSLGRNVASLLYTANTHLMACRRINDANAVLTGSIESTLRRDLAELRQDLTGYIDAQNERAKRKMSRNIGFDLAKRDHVKSVPQFHSKVAQLLEVPASDAESTLRVLRNRLKREKEMRSNYEPISINEDTQNAARVAAINASEKQAQSVSACHRIVDTELSRARDAFSSATLSLSKVAAERAVADMLFSTAKSDLASG